MQSSPIISSGTEVEGVAHHYRKTVRLDFRVPRSASQTGDAGSGKSGQCLRRRPFPKPACDCTDRAVRGKDRPVLLLKKPGFLGYQ